MNLTFRDYLSMALIGFGLLVIAIVPIVALALPVATAASIIGCSPLVVISAVGLGLSLAE